MSSDSPPPRREGSPAGSDQRVLAIDHTYADGTVLSGTRRSDDLYSLLRSHGWLYRRTASDFRLQASQDRPAKLGAIEYTATALRQRGFVVEISIDRTQRPVAEAEAELAERAAARAGRLTTQAERLVGESEAREAAANAVLDHIPLGQPYLVDHSGYRADRRRREAAFANSSRAAELAREARAVGAAAETAAGRMGSRHNPSTVANRIRSISAELRRIQRLHDDPEQAGPAAAGVPPGDGGTENVRPVTARRAEFESHLIGQLRYWTAVRDQQVRDGIATDYSSSDVEVEDLVRYRSSWYPVVRVNRVSVTVPSVLGTWTGTIRYEHLDDIAGPDDPRRPDLATTALATARQMSGGREMHPAWEAMPPDR